VSDPRSGDAGGAMRVRPVRPSRRARRSGSGHPPPRCGRWRKQECAMEVTPYKVN
jgi:hypothetical protein